MNTLEEIIFNIFGTYGIFLIPIIAGIATSFFTEFIDTITVKEIKSIPILIVTGAFFTLLTIALFPVYFPVLIAIDSLFWYGVSLATAVLFYKTLGKWTVKLFFNKLKTKIQKQSEM